MLQYKLKTFFLPAFFLVSILWHNSGGEAYSQTYPVQITAQLTPPFSGYLNDYSSPGNQNLKLLVLFTDFTKPSYNIKLKIKISGQGITIQSKNYYYEGPITLQPGIPVEISGSDIAGLLNNNNLDFTGISINEYEKRKVVPEGFYTICFTAYDYNNSTPIKVSNESCAFGWMVVSDPPFLNLPMCGSTVTSMNPQNVFFQWTPMNLTSPNSANNTVYDFELYEVRPGTQSPGNSVQTLPPVYKVTTPLTMINYGLTEPLLYNGMQYVWRVRARDITNRDLFKNQGYSQLCTFTYGNTLSGIDSSSLKLNLQGSALTYRLAKFYWDSLSAFTSYQLEYRKQGGANWFPVTTAMRSTLVNNLEPQNTYEARVKGIFVNGEGPWSNVVSITTPAKPIIVCGQSMAPPSTANFKPLTIGKAGQVWNVGQFELLVTQLNNSNSPTGMYSGYGTIEIPFLFNISLTGKFTNVKVNEEMEVVEGKVDILTDGQIGGSIINLDSVFGEIDKWFGEFYKTGDTTKLVDDLYGSKDFFCNQSAPNGEFPTFCSLTKTEINDKIKTPGGAEDIRNDIMRHLAGGRSAYEKQKVYEFLAKIKRAYIKGETITVTPKEIFDEYISDATINGIVYDNIRVFAKAPGNSGLSGFYDKDHNITPKNNIADGTSEHAKLSDNSTEQVPCLVVDKLFYVEVSPASRLVNMKYYLENALPTKNLLLFVNGYRLDDEALVPVVEMPDTKNGVYQGDVLSYWSGIDALFMRRIGTTNAVYADGHHSISTSNHKTQPQFMLSLASSANENLAYVKDASRVILDTIANTGGFAIRKANGMKAGNEMIRKITNGEILFNKLTDTLDIVCHSMGFAYAQGMIDIFKIANIKLGRYYIIAPENGCSGSVDLSNFEEVWQYGSGPSDPRWKQDGVAPQCVVGNLDNNRAYIPDSSPKGFTESHMIKNYTWIFTTIKTKGDPGYVQKRY